MSILEEILEVKKEEVKKTPQRIFLRKVYGFRVF